MTYASRRDTNEREIVEYWQRMGCIWIPQSRTAGFDGLLVDTGGLYIVEIKNPSRKYHLTPAEMDMKLRVEDRGGAYNVITSIPEAQLIGLDVVQ